MFMYVCACVYPCVYNVFVFVFVYVYVYVDVNVCVYLL